MRETLFQTSRVKVLVLVISAGLLAACDGGRFDGGLQGRADNANTDNASFGTSEEFFASRVAPRMDFCRTCHIPGGVADTDEGKRFLLSSNSSEDYANTYAAWQTLGRGVESNMLIVENADPNEPHSGGKNWPVGSDAYKDMIALLSCWNNPAQCTLNAVGGGVVPELQPLLSEGHRGGHAWSRYCEGKPDEAALPVDPRALVQPGVNQGKAVYFNAYYKDCHVTAPEEADPTTCGQWRGRVARGGTLLEGNGVVNGGLMFAGKATSESIVQGFYANSEGYNRMWRTWSGGLTERPENFDELVAQRWGMPLSAERNPYPLEGEDPNATNGGSGQLPMAMSQVRTADGGWSGKLGITCHMCHSGKIGEDDELGTPGTLYGTLGMADIGAFGRDLFPAGLYVGPGVAMLARVRGTGNITNLQGFGLLTLGDDPENLPAWLRMSDSASTATEDSPVWWNYGHRPLKFYDGGLPADAQRITIAALIPVGDSEPSAFDIANAKVWIEAHDQDTAAWLNSVKAPVYPAKIDTALAEQGAVLFHSKNLWAAEANAGIQKPKGGNGSCASCHGAYSPRYVNDPAYLEDPALEGIAGYIVPRDLIGTDPARVDGNDQEVAEYAENDWFTYPEQRGTDQDCGDQNLDRIRGDRENGYMAPPLYGVWASAPYFHNGSVPNVMSVLKTSERPKMWRRVSTPNDTGLNVVMGFDTRFGRAYDQQALGWKYDDIACGSDFTVPLLDCDPLNDEGTPLVESVLEVLYSNMGLSWNIPTVLMLPLTDQQIERRKIYSTTLYSQGNEGHAFTDVLNDAERRAIIEYLKTL